LCPFYVRVSSNIQKDDLERQIEAIDEYAKERGWQIKIPKDIESGLNENRKNYHKLLDSVWRSVDDLIPMNPEGS